LEKLLVDGYWT
jgi:hypothetical protein